jgi:hypothetical protein
VYGAQSADSSQLLLAIGIYLYKPGFAKTFEVNQGRDMDDRIA